MTPICNLITALKDYSKSVCVCERERERERERLFCVFHKWKFFSWNYDPLPSACIESLTSLRTYKYLGKRHIHPQWHSYHRQPSSNHQCRSIPAHRPASRLVEGCLCWHKLSGKHCHTPGTLDWRDNFSLRQRRNSMNEMCHSISSSQGPT